MSRLSDMEELIATVPEKEIAEYLHEAYACYGAKAYRACVVLTHIALFDGLLAKVKALAPVNKMAKAVYDEISDRVGTQKVFESTLADKLKSENIISHLEADILGELNKKRNKAAHPSGHRVTAEEARYVFSEAIIKFLSVPLRKTSHRVDEIISNLANGNFFPSTRASETKEIVKHELSDLDNAAIPSLLIKLEQMLDDPDDDLRRNSKSFVFAMSRIGDEAWKPHIVKYIVEKRSSADEFCSAMTTLLNCDPTFLTMTNKAVRSRCLSLLIKNTEDFDWSTSFSKSHHPASAYSNISKILGEGFVVREMAKFTEIIFENVGFVDQFIERISGSPKIVTMAVDEIYDRSSSNTFSIANRMAVAFPDIDKPLANAISDFQALKIIVGLVKGAKNRAFECRELSDGKFNSIPKIKEKALASANDDLQPLEELLEYAGLAIDGDSFCETYLS